MITRRDSLAGSIAFLCELVVAHAQTRNGKTQQQFQRGNGAVFKHDLPNLTMEDWEVTVSYVDYPPGRVGQTHHHAGFVLAYETRVMVRLTDSPRRVKSVRRTITRVSFSPMCWKGRLSLRFPG